MAALATYARPPVSTNDTGAPRRVGIEIEYAGPSLDAVSQLVIDCLGGRRERVNPFRQRVVDTRLGDFKVEMDASLLVDERYLEILRSLGVPVEGSWMQSLLRKIGIEVETERVREAVDELLEELAGGIVPYEIVTPPIPCDAMEQLDPIVAGLRRLGAEGTTTSLLRAFGLHLNPEIARLDAETLLTHLRAAVLLYDWIAWVGEVDFNRRLSPFIDRFPAAYLRLLLRADYAPDLDRFADDYLAANPTRNRWLDLLPLLAEHDLQRVTARAVEPELVNPRPAFHYRLPNSMIDDPRWSIATEWNRWVLIERLAASAEWLEAMCADYLRLQEESLTFPKEKWLRRCAAWLEARVFVG